MDGFFYVGRIHGSTFSQNDRSGLTLRCRSFCSKTSLCTIESAILRATSGLFVAALLLMSTDVQAQGLEAGLRTGSSFSTFRGNTEVVRRGTAYDLQRRSGIQTAGFVAVPLTDVLRLRPELKYVQKGAIVEDTRAFTPTGMEGMDTQALELREPYRLS